jgi:LacI family transcriptional regulator
MNIHDIAKLADVSYMTVSRVLNEPEKVKEKTRLLVQKIVKEQRFVPSHAASAVRQKKKALVGVVLPKLEYAFYETFLNEFTRACMSASLQPEIYFTHYDSEVEAKHVLSLASRRSLGVVVSAATANDWAITTAKAYIPKMIFLGTPETESGGSSKLHSIGFSEEDVANLAVKALLGAGHKKCFVLSSTPRAFKKLPYGESARLQSFEKGFNRAGGEIVGRFDLDNDNYDEKLNANVLVSAMRKKATAFFCENDFAAHKMYLAAQDAKLRIPQDLSVLGVDDIFSSRYLSPALSTIALPYELSVKRIVTFFLSPKKERGFSEQLMPIFRERDSILKI